MANDAVELGPEPSFVGLRSPLPGDGDGLAREPAADEVGSGQVIGVHLADVAPAGHVGPVLRQHPPAERVDLNLADAAPAGPFQAEVKAADT
jgi:hypothetical protein